MLVQQITQNETGGGKLVITAADQNDFNELVSLQGELSTRPGIETDGPVMVAPEPSSPME